MKKIALYLCLLLIPACLHRNAFKSVQRYEYSKDGYIYYKGYTTNGREMLLDSTLRRIIQAYRSIGSIYNGYVWVMNDNDKWGVVNFRNHVLIPFEAAYDGGQFVKGVVAYRKGNKNGARDSKGKEIVPFQYENVYVDKDYNRIIAVGEKSADLYDIKGKIISSGEYEYFSFYNKDHYIVRKNGKLGGVDFDLNVICEPVYDNIGKFETEDNVAWVVLNKKVGYIDRRFKVVIPIEYTDGRIFANGMVRVFKNAETIYLNRKGEIIYPSQQEIKSYDEALARIQAGYDAIQFSS